MEKKWFIVLFLGLWIETVAAAPAVTDARDLMQLELEELGQLVVTSVSKSEKKIMESAAAVYVITQEDIRRKGVTSIPEALRGAPGIEVAQIANNKWAITSRGFNGAFSNKLLVLIDGRTVFSPLYNGTYWDVQDTMLEDVDRIEVIRGPGGTLWGNNAANGVINIITKKAADTQGGLATAGGGVVDRAFGGVRYGGKAGDDAYYRAYVKHIDRAGSETSSGDDGGDAMHQTRGGFRVDWKSSEDNSWTVQGDGYDGQSGNKFTRIPVSLSPLSFNTYIDPIPVSGGNVLARWERRLSDQSGTKLQIYFDEAKRAGSDVDQRIDTFDINFQHNFALGERHSIVWGLGERVISLNLDPSFTVSFTPSQQTNHVANFFVQDEITLVPRLARFIIGTKVEYNTFSDIQVQPNARLLWTPDERHTVWTAVSRAITSPTPSDANIRINFAALPGFRGPPTILSIFGDPNIKAEATLVYELGYRMQPTHRFFFDVNGFVQDMKNLHTAEPGTPFIENAPFPAHLVIPTRFGNLMSARTYGVESSANWKVTDYWRLKAGMTWLRMDLQLDPASGDTLQVRSDGNSPRHQYNVQSNLDLPYNLEFDTAIYYVDRLTNQHIPEYTRLDLRLGWRATKALEFSLISQNALNALHREFTTTAGGYTATEIPRNVYGKITWRF